MRKIILALAAVIGMSSVAHADGYFQPHNGYGYHNQAPMYGRFPEHRRGGGEWVAPLVGGLIIGGVVGAMSQQQNYGYGYNDGYYQQPICQRVLVGNFWNGWTWVRQYQTICQ